jgi:hypothetical protein
MLELRSILCLLSALLIGVQGTLCCCLASPVPTGDKSAGEMAADHSCCESPQASAETPTRLPQRDGEDNPCQHGKCNLGVATADSPAVALALSAACPLVYVLTMPIQLPAMATAEGSLAMIRRGPPSYHGDSLFSLSCLLTI